MRAAHSLLVLAVFLAVAGSAVAGGGPVVVKRVPASIPAKGVTISGVMTLLPARGVRGLISTRRAVAIATTNTDPRVWRKPAALRATVSGAIAIAPAGAHKTWTYLRNPQAWVVTFTAAKPQNVGFGPGGTAHVRHMTVVVDAQDGRFIRGFYTA